MRQQGKGVSDGCPRIGRARSRRRPVGGIAWRAKATVLSLSSGRLAVLGMLVLVDRLRRLSGEVRAVAFLRDER
jgi:hypothetical protein